MLAAQCNKLQAKSPPPLADAAVGKGGFHPWKKCQPGGGPGVSGQSGSGGEREAQDTTLQEDRSPTQPKTGSSQPASPAFSPAPAAAAAAHNNHQYANRKEENNPAAMPCAEPALSGLYPSAYTPSSTPNMHTVSMGR